MREAQGYRKTKETEISMKLNLDGPVEGSIDTGIGFFNHMLELFSFHSGIGLSVEARGDLDVDDHHTVEDIGILLGTLLREALADRAGIRRYGNFFLPMDEALANVAVDISGRPYLVYNCLMTRERLGTFSTEMMEEFFRAVSVSAGLTLHINLLYGTNDHHKAEAVFKGFGRALGSAMEIVGTAIPSSKGMLE